MTSCPRCKSVRVVLDHAKDGHAYLRDYGANHYYTCPARNGPKAKKKAKKAKKAKMDTEMLEALRGLGWDARKVKRLLPFAVGDTFEARFRAALAYADSEGGS